MMDSREKARERHRRYNLSAKGQARNRKYEEAHPERKQRWAPIMIYRAQKGRTNA